MSEQERTMSFMFVRMHFPEIFGASAKASIYDNLVKMQDSREEVKDYYWAFGDIGKIDIDGKTLIFGRLGKTAKSRFEVVYDEKHHSYKKELLNIQKTNYSNFFVSPGFGTVNYFV